MLHKKSFTLMEMIVVIIIIGILAALALPGFGVSKERVLDREAKANLALIQAAEKIYRMEAGAYYPSPTASPNYTSIIADINTYLRVNLPTGGVLSWDYTVNSNDSNITASRRPSNNRVWTLTYTGDTPSCTSTDSSCPP